MQVSPIKISHFNSSSTKRQTSFKGLWGSSYSESESTDKYTDYIVKTEYYYPFLDETESEINHLKSQYPKGSLGIYTNAFPEYGYNETINLSVEDRLPFTKSEWRQYTKNKFHLKSNTRNFIEEALKQFNLKSYLK